jgi:uridine phosphorylase
VAHKHHVAPSVFTPENLLREARRQKELPPGSVPAVCVLDPDGDLVDFLHASGAAQRHPTWACYHTTLATFKHHEVEFGLLGRVVGAPFAVLVAEELFASGCQLLMGQSGEDFEKGEVLGSQTLLHIIGQAAHTWNHMRHQVAAHWPS